LMSLDNLHTLPNLPTCKLANVETENP
jgi:hypothetical protein